MSSKAGFGPHLNEDASDTETTGGLGSGAPLQEIRCIIAAGKKPNRIPGVMIIHALQRPRIVRRHYQYIPAAAAIARSLRRYRPISYLGGTLS